MGLPWGSPGPAAPRGGWAVPPVLEGLEKVLRDTLEFSISQGQILGVLHWGCASLQSWGVWVERGGALLPELCRGDLLTGAVTLLVTLT